MWTLLLDQSCITIAQFIHWPIGDVCTTWSGHTFGFFFAFHQSFGYYTEWKSLCIQLEKTQRCSQHRLLQTSEAWYLKYKVSSAANILDNSFFIHIVDKWKMATLGMADNSQIANNSLIESRGNTKHSLSPTTTARVGVQHLFDKTPPHESYEGAHRYDPKATWSKDEESALVRKTDLYLLSWVCLMVKYSSWVTGLIVELTLLLGTSSSACNSTAAIYLTHWLTTFSKICI